MAVNTSVLSGRNGIIRILTLVLGIISLSLAANTYANNVAREEFFLAIAIILFICSVIWIVLAIFEVVGASDLHKKVDIGLQLIGGLVLLIAAIVWTISAFEFNLEVCRALFSAFYNCDSLYAKRVVAGILGIINGVLYIVLGLYLYKG